ncbi:deoxyribose-phosphate aldolase [Phialemonium atrogriseum]|uniref:deoxyribose-phosphate aldolase n=1 Tax=Phialemonium atrogriseum TaxID=1093897 RepID=A0AAJ0BZM0_9PEZI|nr:deoxyribose-phosphate aldolase [Phialemonium atrogriseum]KAK1767453.1 deoxyribose-phosphate aldolase [Phialemonium atrogriseum]
MATLTVTLGSLAKLIDHSLLHPTMTDAEVDAGLAVARSHGVAAACVKPYSVPAAVRALSGSGVLVCAVAGFPHGSSTTASKVAEAAAAVAAGAHEVDVVVNVGKVLGGDWGYVRDEIRAVNDAVVGTPVGGDDGGGRNGILKVIFENDYLGDEQIARLCGICSEVGVAFVKTSTGYGFVKQPDGAYSYRGATVPHLRLMRASCGPDVRIKAAGGVRTLDEFLYVASLGVTRVGASATVAIMEEARRRGITEQPTEVTVKPIGDSLGGTY